jgi:hypothetical protein
MEVGNAQRAIVLNGDEAGGAAAMRRVEPAIVVGAGDKQGVGPPDEGGHFVRQRAAATDASRRRGGAARNGAQATALNVFGAVRKCLFDGHVDQFVRDLTERAVDAIAAARAHFDEQQANPGRWGQIRPERIGPVALVFGAADHDALAIGCTEKTGRAIQHRRPELALGVAAGDDDHELLVDERTRAQDDGVGHDGAIAGGDRLLAGLHLHRQFAFVKLEWSVHRRSPCLEREDGEAVDDQLAQAWQARGARHAVVGDQIEAVLDRFFA